MQNKDYKFVFLSHNIYDYKSIPNVWINEARMNLKLDECYILNYKLNDNVVINQCLNLIELIYSWSLKLAIIDFLLEVESPLTRSQISVLTGPSYRWTKFQIVRSSFSRCRIAVSVQRLIFNSVWCRLAVIKMSVSRLLQWLLQWSILQNYSFALKRYKIYYGPKLYETCHISPFPEF